MPMKLVACEICGHAPPYECNAVHRLNETGKLGRWTCEHHAPVFGAYYRRVRRVDRFTPDMGDGEIDDCVSHYRDWVVCK